MQAFRLRLIILQHSLNFYAISGYWIMTNQEKANRSYFKKFLDGYRFSAMIILNTLVVSILIINSILFLFFNSR